MSAPWLVIVLLVAVVVGLWIGLAVGRRLARRAGERTGSDEPLHPPSGLAPKANEVLDELRLGIAIAGDDGVAEFRNAAARSMAGTHVGVLLDEAIERHLARGVSGGRSDEVVEIHGPPRSVFVVRSAPLPNGGSVAFVEDVSERRRVEQVRTDFVANVSHELKTPVGALSVLAETLQDETDLEIVRRLAGRMLAESERAANTIDDLMELTRIELGGDHEIVRVPVSDLLDAAIGRVRELAGRAGITITGPDSSEQAHPVAIEVEGDRRQLVSALGNLVENAVKYSEAGSSVEVEVRAIDDVVEVDVVDHGIGIPANDVTRVFERFYRVDQARSRATGGTGLGLSIVRNVATRHGGDVSVRSVEGEGSTFTLRLPLAGRVDGATVERDVTDAATASAVGQDVADDATGAAVDARAR